MPEEETTEILKNPKEIIKIYIDNAAKAKRQKFSEYDQKVTSQNELRKQVEEETVLERMSKYAYLSDGFFSLDSSDLMHLVEEPENVDIIAYLEDARRLVGTYEYNDMSMKEVSKALRKLEKQFLETTAKDKVEIDHDLALLLRTIEKFRKANRIEVGEESTEEKANTNSIGQLDI